MATYYKKSGNSLNNNSMSNRNNTFYQVKINLKFRNKSCFENSIFIECKFNFWFKLYRLFSKYNLTKKPFLKNCEFIHNQKELSFI